MKKNKIHNIKSTGFETPDHYFESFESKLFERLTENELIKDIEEPGYTVPNGYFDSVEDTVFSKLRHNNSPVISLNSRKSFYFIAGIAASLLLLFAVFINNESSEYISAEVVEVYLENRDLSSYELAELLSDVNLLEDDFTIIQTPYEEGNLESYLLEYTDIETILEK
jgi:hypothetical protein